jgi:hypothetical protein
MASTKVRRKLRGNPRERETHSRYEKREDDKNVKMIPVHTCETG